MMNDLERKVLDFIVYYTYNTLHEKGGEARMPYHILQANFLAKGLDDAVNTLIEKGYITRIKFKGVSGISCRCTEKGAKVSTAIYRIPKDTTRILVVNNSSIGICNKEDYANWKTMIEETKGGKY